MKKRILAMLIAVVMLFSLTACNETNDTNKEGEVTTNDGGGGTIVPTGEGCEKCGLAECNLEKEGWTCCIWPGDDAEEGEDPNECINCGGAFWDNGCQKLYAMHLFNKEQGDKGDKTLLNINTFTDETLDMLNFFLKENPEFTNDYFIQLEYNTTSGAHRMAVDLNLDKDGEDGIDLFVADVDYAMEFADLAGTATIADLGIEITESEYYAYTLDLMRKGDDIMGLSHQATPGAMYFRADVAADLFDIEKDADMQELVKDWDSFIEVAEKVVEETDFHVLAGADELKRNFINARDEGWVVDGTFNVDYDTVTEFVEVTGAIKDMEGLKVNAAGQQWSSSWTEGMGDVDEGVFAYFGSTWYLHYTLGDNAKETEGLWGMVPGPQEFYWGGTYWFGSKVAAADDAKKAGVAQIIEFFCVNDDEAILWMEETGDFPSKKAVAEKLADDYDGNDFFKFKTNHFEIFADIAERIDITKNITRYDDIMNGLFDDFIANVFSEDESIDDAIDILSEAVKEAIPSIDVH